MEGVTKRWSGPKQHTTLEERAKMIPEYRQVPQSNEKADELSRTGVIQDGAAVAEHGNADIGACGHKDYGHFS